MELMWSSFVICRRLWNEYSKKGALKLFHLFTLMIESANNFPIIWFPCLFRCPSSADALLKKPRGKYPSNTNDLNSFIGSIKINSLRFKIVSNRILLVESKKQILSPHNWGELGRTIRMIVFSLAACRSRSSCWLISLGVINVGSDNSSSAKLFSLVISNLFNPSRIMIGVIWPIIEDV